jgi:hypothetical protein
MRSGRRRRESKSHPGTVGELASDIEAAGSERQHLAGVEDAGGIKGLFDSGLGVEVDGRAPPSFTHSSTSSSAAAWTFSSIPGSLASKAISGWRLPSPA